MNVPEAIFLFFLLSVLAGYFFLYTRRIIKSLALVLIISPALYLSIETTSQFMTVDEIYIIRETADLDFHYMAQWYAGANRTTDALLGTFSRIVRVLFSPSDYRLKMTLKLAHFFIGFFVLLLIHAVSFRRISGQGGFGKFSVLFFYVTLLLPLSVFALKVFNYDLLSMYLGILALLLIASAFERKSGTSALFSVICAYLAAQEKLSATPILLLCLSLYGLVGTDIRLPYFFCTVFIKNARGIAIALATGMMSVVLVGLAGSGDFPRSFAVRTIDPLTTSFIQPIMRFTFGGESFVTFSYFRYAALLILAVLLLWVSSCFVVVAYRLSVKYYRYPSWLSAYRHSSRIVPALIVITGVLSTNMVQHHFCYFDPGSFFPFVHTEPFNNTVTHFEQATIVGHLLASIGYAYAVFVNAVPSVIWLMLGSVLFFPKRSPSLPSHPWYEESVRTALLLVPFLWGAMQIPVNSRYFNIMVVLFVVIVTIHFTRTLFVLSSRSQVLLTAGVILLFTAEVVPFKPIFSAFRPIWSSFPDAIPQPTRGNPSWVGWGEDVMLAGKRIERMITNRSNPFCAKERKPTLYTYYAGDYMRWSAPLPFDIKFVLKDSSFYKYDVEMHLARLGKTCVKSQVVYECSSLFLISRYNFIVDSIVFPEKVQPVFTLSYRGYPQAWVFRGDALHNAGIRF